MPHTFLPFGLCLTSCAAKTLIEAFALPQVLSEQLYQ